MIFLSPISVYLVVWQDVYLATNEHISTIKVPIHRYTVTHMMLLTHLMPLTH